MRGEGDEIKSKQASKRDRTLKKNYNSKKKQFQVRICYITSKSKQASKKDRTLHITLTTDQKGILFFSHLLPKYCEWPSLATFSQPFHNVTAPLLIYCLFFRLDGERCDRHSRGYFFL